MQGTGTQTQTGIHVSTPEKPVVYMKYRDFLFLIGKSSF